MKNLLLISILCIICTTTSFGQLKNKIKKKLESKDFVDFQNYSVSISDKKNEIRTYWKYLRDLTSNYKEGILIIEKSVPILFNKNISNVYTYRVTLITTDTKIVCYEFSEKKYKKIGDELIEYYDPITKYTDEILYDSLKKSFKDVFKADFNENELFLTDIVYGEDCGIFGSNPKAREKVNTWVVFNNKEELLNWLKSTNTEKQIYAVDGLFQLRQKGTTFTEEELKIINSILNKKGTIQTCSGCLYFLQEIVFYTNKFVFD